MRSLKPISAELLSDLPNLRRELVADLQHVGLTSSEALETIGAEAAWELLATGIRSPDLETLFRLEGAIARLEWQRLGPARRFELMQFLIRRAA